MDISSWITHRAAWSPDKVAVRFEGEELTYAGLERAVARLAGGLGQLGVRAGDRVAYLGWNSPLILELLFACARLGAVFVPLNARLALPELAEVVGDAEPAVLVAGRGFEELSARLAADVGARVVVATWGVRAEQALAGDAVGCDAGISVSCPVLIAYTSGTTGRPKGAVLTQEALLYNALNAVAALDMTSGDEVLTVLPMFHVGGLNITTTPALYAGATVTVHERFHPARALEEIERRRVSLVVAVPPVAQAMASHPGFGRTDVSSLRCLLTGSTVVAPEVMQPWFERGVAVTQVYGLTETCPIAAVVPLPDAHRKAGSAGKAVAHCSVRVVDACGQDVAVGETGEIVVRGPNVLREYWRKPEATTQAFVDGWFRSGDLGHTDNEGYLYVDARVKDVIIVGGSNVYPAELERVLSRSPAIAEVAVVGRADPELGEVPVACVVPAPGHAVTGEDVLAMCDGQIAAYKQPRELRVVESLPRNALGKLLRHELSELVTSTSPSR